MTVVSSAEFAASQEEELMIFEPDEDFYRAISIEELRRRVKEDIHQWYKGHE